MRACGRPSHPSRHRLHIHHNQRAPVGRQATPHLPTHPPTYLPPKTQPCTRCRRCSTRASTRSPSASSSTSARPASTRRPSPKVRCVPACLPACLLACAHVWLGLDPPGSDLWARPHESLRVSCVYVWISSIASTHPSNHSPQTVVKLLRKEAAKQQLQSGHPKPQPQVRRSKPLRAMR